MKVITIAAIACNWPCHLPLKWSNWLAV